MKIMADLLHTVGHNFLCSVRMTMIIIMMKIVTFFSQECNWYGVVFTRGKPLLVFHYLLPSLPLAI